MSAKSLPDIQTRLQSEDVAVRASAGAQLCSQIVDAAAIHGYGPRNPAFVEINARLVENLASNNVQDWLECTAILSSLVDIDMLDDTQQTRIALQLRALLGRPSLVVGGEAAKIFVRLVGKKWPIVLTTMDINISLSLEWLGNQDSKVRRMTSMLIVEELQKNAPALLYSHLANVISLLCVSLMDPEVEVRLAAASALGHCLLLVYEQEQSMQEQSMQEQSLIALFETQQQGYHTASIEGLHATLLISHELVRHRSAHMQEHFVHTCELALRLKDHHNHIIREAAISLLPQLAHCNPQAFCQPALDGEAMIARSCNFLIRLAATDEHDRATALLALGSIAQACRADFMPFLEPTTRAIRDVLVQRALSSNPITSPTEDKPVLAILQTIAWLAEAMGSTLAPYMNRILDLMFTMGLSEELCESLRVLQNEIGQLLPAIRGRLLDMVSNILHDTPFRPTYPSLDRLEQSMGTVSLHHSSLSGNHVLDSGAARATPSIGNDTVSHVVAATRRAPVTPEVIVLALSTLSRFDFSDENLSEFVRLNILQYLVHADVAVRKQAIHAVSQIVLSDPLYATPIGAGAEIVSQVVHGLVTAAIADRDIDVRLTAITVINSNSLFDFQMGKSQNIQRLLLLLNDEVFDMRLNALAVAGRLSKKNPAYLQPTLRRMVTQLLTEFDLARSSSEREECIQLLITLALTAEYWVRPFVDNILQVITPHIDDSPPQLACKLFDIVAALARAGGSHLASYHDRLLTSITLALGDQTSAPKRMSALQALQDCIAHSGLNIDPQTRYQPLFVALTGMVRNEPEDRRVEITRVIGSIGAIDRRRYKITMANVADTGAVAALGAGTDANKALEGRRKDGRRGKKSRRYGGPAPNVLTIFNGDKPQDCMIGGVPVNTYGQPFIDDNYYIEVSVVALLQILDTAPDVSFRHMAAEALVLIFGHLPGYHAEYLDRILPAMLQAIETTQLGQSDSFIGLLRQLVGIARQLAIPYADSLLGLIGTEFPADEHRQLALIDLIEAVTFSLSGNLGEHISSVVLFLISVVEKDETMTRKPTIYALRTLQVISPSLETYLFLVVPRLLLLLNPSAELVSVVEPALECVLSVIDAVNCNSFALRIVHKLDYLLQCLLPQRVQIVVVDVLCKLMEQLQDEFLLFMPAINDTIAKFGVASHDIYNQYSSLLLSHMRIPKGAPRALAMPRRDSLPVDRDVYRNAVGRQKLEINEDLLRQSWDIPQRTAKDDWVDWMGKFSSELLRQSPSPALRACLGLASKPTKLSEDLFNAAFISCWNEISEEHRRDIGNKFQEIAQLPDMSADILKMMLRLADLMERNRQEPFVSRELLGEYANRCHSLAKELRYREAEWVDNQDYDTIEKLIVLNQNLDLHDSAIGMLNYVRKEQPHIYNSDQWRLRLQQWDETLGVYENLRGSDNSSCLSMSDNIRRMFDSSNWEALIPIYKHIWDGEDKQMQEASAQVGMCLTWAMGEFDLTEQFMNNLPDDAKDKSLYMALLYAQRGQFDEAIKHIQLTREKMQISLISYISEPYSRGYRQVFRCQMLTELEEAIAYKTFAHDEQKAVIVKTWRQRFFNGKRDVGMWLKSLRLHSIAVRPIHDIDLWIKFINTSRSAGQLTIARNAMFQLLQDEGNYYNEIIKGELGSVSPILASQAKNYVYLKAMAIEQQEQQSPMDIVASGNNDKAAESTSAAWERRLNRFDKEGRPDALSGVSLDNVICLTRQPAIVYMYVKYKWSTNECKEAFQMMEMFVETFSKRIGFDPHNSKAYVENGPVAARISSSSEESKTAYYLSRLYCKRAEWLIKVQQDSSCLAQKAREKAKWRFRDVNCIGHVAHKASSKRRGRRAAVARLNNVVSNRRALSTASTRASVSSSESEDQASSDIEFIFKQQGNSINETILESYRAATVLDSKWYKAWHSLALHHYFEAKKYEKRSRVSSEVIKKYVVPAIHGFSRAIMLFKEDTTLQDTLRLLTVWFSYSEHESVVQAVFESINYIPLQTWLQVIPQILARIHIKSESTSRLIKQLLAEVGKFHPHAILFSLYVAARSDNLKRSQAAWEVLTDLHILCPKLVNETGVVSQDLIRTAMLPCEMWHEALTDMETCLYLQNNLDEVVKTLRSLHSQLRNAQTMPELRFVNRYGKQLAAAEMYLEKYISSAPMFRDETLLDTAWKLYYGPVYRANANESFAGQRMALKVDSLLLDECTVTLMQSNNMNLAVPGTYDPASEVVLIESFRREAALCKTKKRPRHIFIRGSDGHEYRFILKGNEDMRQDERAMQLFGLIKLLLSRDNEAARRSLAIEQFPVIPLSSGCGLAGFYPNCEDLHDIVRKYRLSNNLEPYYENDLAKKYSKEWEYLPVPERLKLFKIIWNRAPGDDLKRALWYKAPSAEEWLTRRTNYTRSTAVMAMTGYILGLGDRHMSNIMMHERTGKIVHIDFGDCFEITAQRPQFPEKVPFRLTRMITSAMELGTIEGTFKFSANHTMRVLRANQESLMAVLEAFVFDPLVSWYYTQDPQDPADIEPSSRSTTPVGTPPSYYARRGLGHMSHVSIDDLLCGSRPDESYGINPRIKDEGADDGSWQYGNPKAIRIINRIRDKLAGADFGPHQHLGVAEQVEKLVEQATSLDNLAVLFPGWMGFW
ncbi:phosphatidylinositol kinase- protein kinase tor1 [Coemansia sp. BCRC 34301]|nr:phosphatidylinositol kinase- protein kinase tor1 [Coemansia sp. BCRC 34301]